MRSGILQHRLKFRPSKPVRDLDFLLKEDGGFLLQENGSKIILRDVQSDGSFLRWGQVKGASQSELVDGVGFSAVDVLQVKIRQDPDSRRIEPNWRAEYNGKTYNVNSSVDPNGMRRDLMIILTGNANAS